MAISGSCHCGNIAFSIDQQPTQAIECNCSICRRRAPLLSAVSPDEFRLETPRKNLATYTFNSHNIQHRHCAVCGCAPFSEGVGPGGQAMVMVNLRCTDADLEGITRIPYDGASR